MAKESEKEKKIEQTEEHLADQYEFGLNEETRKKLAKEGTTHTEPEDIAEEEDIIINEDKE